MDWIKLYKEEKMEEGKKTESLGIKERKDFLSEYPIECIPNLTIEQYASGDNSFSRWLLYGLPHITKPGDVRPDVSDIYTNKAEPSKILLSKKRYKKKFGSDYEKAFIFLKKEIVNFLKDIEQENYNTFENYKINSIMRNMLMIVYFSDRFVPVRVEPKINDCLYRVGILKENENKSMVYKNLALVEWKKTVPELADWSNQIVLDFCIWLKDKIS